MEGRLGLSRIGHLDEAKASRASRHSVCNNLGAIDDAIGFEELAQLFVRGPPSQIPDKDTHRSSFSARVALRCKVCRSPPPYFRFCRKLPRLLLDCRVVDWPRSSKRLVVTRSS